MKQLQGLLPICSYCKKIRDEQNYGNVDSYLSAHTDVMFSHGIRPDCYRRSPATSLLESFRFSF